MTFRNALLDALAKNDASSWNMKLQDAAYEINNASARHPILWKAAEFVVRRQYQKQTGKKLPRDFDFSKIVEWLTENMGTILKILIPLLLLLI